jgi:hypothetical protein
MWFWGETSRARLLDRQLSLEHDLRSLQDRVAELDERLRRYMGRENQRLRRELSPPSTPDSSGSQMNGEDYQHWVNDPISQKIRQERAAVRRMQTMISPRRSEPSDTTDKATSSETSSEPSVMPLVPRLPGWPP